MFIQRRAFAILLNKVTYLIFSTWLSFINNNVLCFILTYSHRIIFMYIFGYFFQNGYFKGPSKKGHIDKKLWEGGADDSLSLPAPEGLIQYLFYIFCILYKIFQNV